VDTKEYKRRVIEHLRHGKASETVWEEVAEQLLAASEACEPLLLDVELGFAWVCECSKRVWAMDEYKDDPCPRCGLVRLRLTDSMD